MQAQVAQVRAPVEYLEVPRKRERAACWPSTLGPAQQAPRALLPRHCSYVGQSDDLDDGYTSASRYECFD